MITVEIPAFEDTDTEFTVLISYPGQDHVERRVFPMPLTEQGEIDHNQIQALQWGEYLRVNAAKHEIWPGIPPDPERPQDRTEYGLRSDSVEAEASETPLPPDPGTGHPEGLEPIVGE